MVMQMMVMNKRVIGVVVLAADRVLVFVLFLDGVVAVAQEARYGRGVMMVMQHLLLMMRLLMVTLLVLMDAHVSVEIARL